MTDNQAFALIGQRAKELSKDPAVMEKAEKVYKQYGLDSAERYVYMLAIATLAGM